MNFIKKLLGFKDHSFRESAIIEVSQTCFDELHSALITAGFGTAVYVVDGETLLDMQNLAISTEPHFRRD